MSSHYQSVYRTEKKMSRKKFWLLLFLGMLATFLLIAAVLLVLYLTSPLKAIVDAALKTSDAFVLQKTSVDSIPELLGVYDRLTEDGRYSYRLYGQTPLADFGNVILDMTGNRERDAKEQDGQIILEVLGDGTLALPYYTDNDSFRVDFSQVFEDTSLVFSVEDFVTYSNKLLGQTFLSPGWKPFPDERSPFDTEALEDEISACTRALLSYALSLRPRQVRTYTVGSHQWTDYSLDANEKQQQALLNAAYACIEEAITLYEATAPDPEAATEEATRDLMEYLRHCMDTAEDLVVALDDRGYLVAITVTMEEAQVVCRLEGDSNPWEKIVIHCANADETLLLAEITTQNDVLVLDAALPAHELEIGLSYENASRAFSASVDSPSVWATVQGSIDGNDAALSLQADIIYCGQQIDLTYDIMEQTDAPTPIRTGYSIDLHDLSFGDGMNLIKSYQGDNGNWIIRKLLEILLPNLWGKLPF